MYLRTRAHLRRVVRQDPRNFSLSSRLSLSLYFSPLLPLLFLSTRPLFFVSFSPLVTLLLKRPLPYCFFGKYRETFVVITLQRVRNNSTPRIIEVYTSHEKSTVRTSRLSIDLLEISFDTPRAGRGECFEASPGNARALTSITTGLSPRSEELRHHIVVARVSAATSTLPLNRPSGEPATTPGTKALLPSPARSGYPPAETTLQGASIYVHC